jgi:hypothetical protein
MALRAQTAIKAQMEHKVIKERKERKALPGALGLLELLAL